MGHSGSGRRRLLVRLGGFVAAFSDRPPGHVSWHARTVRRDLMLWEGELTGPRPGCLDPEVRHPPIEQVAAQLRRLRAVLDELPADVSFIRWEGVLRAYDDFLWLACRELQVPTDLRTIGFGRGRNDERRRLELLLHEVGLSVR